MNKLSKKQESFVELMLENDDQARYGFNLINNKDNLLNFYDTLAEKGFFSYERIINSGAHDYLQKAMMKCSSINNKEIAGKIISCLHQLTKEAKAKNQEIVDENYWIIFARVFSETSPSHLSNKDIELVEVWLKMITSTLTDGGIITKLIPNLLESPLHTDHIKACLLIKYCTLVHWIDDKFAKTKIQKFKISDYCVTSIFKKYAKKLGELCGIEASSVLVDRLKELHSNESLKESWVWLPAIEEHCQNIIHDECKPILIFGLRDILIAWFSFSVDHDFVIYLLDSKVEILERIAIFVFTENFEDLKSLFNKIINPKFLNRNHIHEIYQLLNHKFVLFTDMQKQFLIDCIKNLPPPKNSKDPEASKSHLQQRMLHAIYKKGSKEGDELYLLLETKIGPAPNHPDFYVYIESWQTSDESPFDVKELISFLDQGKLIDQLNAFKMKDESYSPNIRGLVRVLEEAIKSNPARFLAYKDDFLNANPPYQFGFINGYFELWKIDKLSSNQLPNLWNAAWLILFDFFERLILDSTFWQDADNDDGDLIPKKSWIPPLIAEFLRSGMHVDDRAFSQDLLPRAFILIKNLLRNVSSEHRWHEKDAMIIAINSSKGKVIEALMNYALRLSRLTEKNLGNHLVAWKQVETTFNEELEKCQNDNFEFSTLMASYIENLNYLSHQWLANKMSFLFPVKYIQNFSSAVQGLAYTHGTSAEVYYLLRDNGIFELSIKDNIVNGEIKKQLISRIGLAYLWGKETLDSKIFTYLFNNSSVDELKLIARFFWSIQTQDITKADKDHIIGFWRRCIAWYKKQSEQYPSLLSSLGLLSCYLDELDEEKKNWLLMSAPHVTSVNSEMHFLEDLLQLSEKSPAAVLDVLEELLKCHMPHYDIGNYLKSLLAKMGQHNNEDIRKRNLIICDKLRNLSGFQDLYVRLTQGNLQDLSDK